MHFIDFSVVIKQAWDNFDASKKIKYINDISAKVSTNHVFKVGFEDDSFIIAKLSYFGKYENFREDHMIINTLSNNLLFPFDNVIGRSLMKSKKVYTYRFKDDLVDAWVVFYNPVRIDQKPPKRLNEDQIKKLAVQIARFHKACDKATNVLPKSSKTLKSDIGHLLDILDTEHGRYEHRMYHGEIIKQCERFLVNSNKLGIDKFKKIPVFVDWNIGNFSVTTNWELYSRWDYDWFRMSSRVLDFYFFARVVSDIGDRTVFSYLLDPFMEERFILFLKTYHEEFPLTENEILFLKEAYRFFILNYVIKDGRYFFHELYSAKLQREAYEIYFPELEEKFKPEKLLNALGF